MLMSMYLTRPPYGADAATFRLNFPRQGLLLFFQSLTVGYTLVRQRATSLSATTAVRVSVFCLQSSVYFPLHFVNACTLSKPCARATALAFVVTQSCLDQLECTDIAHTDFWPLAMYSHACVIKVKGPAHIRKQEGLRRANGHPSGKSTKHGA